MINLLLNAAAENEKKFQAFIVDDCKLMRDKIKEFLLTNTLVKILGEARNVKEGLELLCKLDPDVAFLDINLPDGTGMDILIHLKKTKPLTKVVIFSNSSADCYKRKFKEMGSDFFLDKSKDFTKIPHVIDQLISSRQSDVLSHLTHKKFQ